MKIHNVVILVFLFLFVSVFAAAKEKEVVVGGWTPIKNINDPHVAEIAHFAVSQYNQQSGKKLSLVKTIKGETQVVAGTNYRLVLTANDGSATKDYVVVVLEKPWIHFKNLTSFNPVKEVVPGGWTPIKNINDPHVAEIAHFAVSQYNQQSGKKLTLVKTIKGETQVVAGTNYRLVLTANDGSATNDYVVVVYEKPWIHFKNLTSFNPVKKGVLGGWTPIKNISDPHVVEIAQFAVTQYDKQSGKKLSLVKIINGETQVVEGINYGLELAANDGYATKNYKAIVWEKSWVHFRNLTSFTPLLG